MEFAFCCLGSGSKGNATLVKARDAVFMIDNGFSLKYIEKAFAQRHIALSQLKAIFVTHEHSDHSQGVAALANKYNLPVYATAGSFRSAKLASVKKPRELAVDQILSIDIVDGYTLDVLPVTVPHDARQACQFVFAYQQRRLGVLTDLGSISAHVKQHFSQLDALLLEANHDLEMLQQGPYPASLKRRVSGDWGHLNNQQAFSFAEQICVDRLSHLVIGHISEQNNSIAKVKETFAPLSARVANIIYATQSDGFDWIPLAANVGEDSDQTQLDGLCAVSTDLAAQ